MSDLTFHGAGPISRDQYKDAENRLDVVEARVAANIAVVAGLVPAGGTGATAGAFDTSGHRDTFIATVTEIKTQLNAIQAALVAAGLMAAS